MAAACLFRGIPLPARLGGSFALPYSCYERALRLYTEVGFPLERARAQFNLGLALRELERSDEARAVFLESASGFTSAGYPALAAEASAEAAATGRVVAS